MVRIFGEEFAVKAEVRSLDYYSAHADYDEILNWLSCQNAKKVKAVFLVHGETEALDALKHRLNDKGFNKIRVPYMKEKFDLST